MPRTNGYRPRGTWIRGRGDSIRMTQMGADHLANALALCRRKLEKYTDLVTELEAETVRRRYL